jgi:hypothetical protein
VHQQTCRGALLQATAFQVARHLGELHQFLGQRSIDSGFGGDDLAFQIRSWIVEFQRHEALPGRLFEVFQDALVTGVVGNRQTEIRRGFQQLAQLFHRQGTAVVGQRVDDHHGVLARLDNLVQITDATNPHSAGQRAIDPDRLATLDQKTANQIGRSQVVMT